MGTRTAAPDDLAPLGMACCGLRGAWTDIRKISQSSQNVTLCPTLGVDPVSRAAPCFSQGRQLDARLRQPIVSWQGLCGRAAEPFRAKGSAGKIVRTLS